MFARLRSIPVIADLLGTAETVAHRSGATAPGAEHVLLAALHLPDGLAAGVLEGFGVDADRLAEVLAAERVEPTASAGPSADRSPEVAPAPPRLYRSQDSVRTLLDRTRAAYRAHPTDRLTSAHVLLAACDLDPGPLTRALARLELDRAALRAGTLAALDRAG